MKVRMLVSMAGLDFVHNAGDIIDVAADEANRYFEAGIAETLNGKKSERAVPKQEAETR